MIDPGTYGTFDLQKLEVDQDWFSTCEVYSYQKYRKNWKRITPKIKNCEMIVEISKLFVRKKPSEAPNLFLGGSIFLARSKLQNHASKQHLRLTSGSWTIFFFPRCCSILAGCNRLCNECASNGLLGRHQESRNYMLMFKNCGFINDSVVIFKGDILDVAPSQ